MNKYINLTLENIDDEHICCAIGDKKHQAGVDSKKEWIKSKLKDGHIFRKLNARGKIFIEYEPIETAWIPISGKNYEYIYCLWVAGSFKGKGIGKELLEYAINDSKEKGKITLTLKKLPGFVEFKVTDNGIGVPKSEQQHLFNKFFRATNARRARPDGTGVGLFLAKKVIDDHGGTLIFESKEGKGSTFGFRLPIPKTKK